MRRLRSVGGGFAAERKVALRPNGLVDGLLLMLNAVSGQLGAATGRGRFEQGTFGDQV
jgi:hypothetical protein